METDTKSFIYKFVWQARKFMIILSIYSIPKTVQGYSCDQRIRNPPVCHRWKSRRALTFLSESSEFATMARATAFSTLAEKQICFFLYNVYRVIFIVSCVYLARFDRHIVRVSIFLPDIVFRIYIFVFFLHCNWKRRHKLK